jgi:hypothetical protein
MTADALRIFREFDRDLFDIEQRDTGMVQQRFAGRRQRLPSPEQNSNPSGRGTISRIPL